MGEATADPLAQGARLDLHCHTSASFDGVADPVALVARAAERGLTHVAITDHDTLEGALRARDAAPAGLGVIIGCEVNTREGDLVFAFLLRPLPRDLSAREAILAGREQGALIGIPHPYDHARRSLLLDPANEELVRLVDWVETWNGRVGRRAANDRAAALALRIGLPGVGVSDAHTLLEVGTVCTTMSGDPSTPDGLREALRAGTAILGADRAPRLGRLRQLLRSPGGVATPVRRP
jgi:predicted metal-dependent phosphoesterase TrpH